MDIQVVISASSMSDADILKKVIPDSIEDQDDDVIEDLDFSPALTRPSKSDVEEALETSFEISLCLVPKLSKLKSKII